MRRRCMSLRGCQQRSLSSILGRGKASALRDEAEAVALLAGVTDAAVARRDGRCAVARAPGRSRATLAERSRGRGGGSSCLAVAGLRCRFRDEFGLVQVYVLAVRPSVSRMALVEHG